MKLAAMEGGVAHGDLTPCALHRGGLPRPEGAGDLLCGGDSLGGRPHRHPLAGPHPWTASQNWWSGPRSNIARGVIAFDALQKIRAAAGNQPVDPADLTEGVRGQWQSAGLRPAAEEAMWMIRVTATPDADREGGLGHGACRWRRCSGLFRIMVGVGFFVIACFTGTFFVLSARRQRWTRYPHPAARSRCCRFRLPWIAAESGWFVAEFGRQPWIIEGILPTAAGGLAATAPCPCC